MAEELKKTSKVAAALVAAQKAVKAVSHDKENAYHRYRYASAEAVITEARSALAAADLAAICTGWRLVASEVEAAPAVVEATFSVVHASGEALPEMTVALPAVPEKGRPLDKAACAALTTAESYFLRGLLLIPRVAESDDIAGRDDRSYEPPAPTKVPAEKLRALGKLAAERGLKPEEVQEQAKTLYGCEVRALSPDQLEAISAWVEGHGVAA